MQLTITQWKKLGIARLWERSYIWIQWNGGSLNTGLFSYYMNRLSVTFSVLICEIYIYKIMYLGIWTHHAIHYIEFLSFRNSLIWNKRVLQGKCSCILYIQVLHICFKWCVSFVVNLCRKIDIALLFCSFLNPVLWWDNLK